MEFFYFNSRICIPPCVLRFLLCEDKVISPGWHERTHTHTHTQPETGHSADRYRPQGDWLCQYRNWCLCVLVATTDTGHRWGFPASLRNTSFWWIVLSVNFSVQWWEHRQQFHVSIYIHIYYILGLNNISFQHRHRNVCMCTPIVTLQEARCQKIN